MKRKLRVTLDTNVLISGMFWSGISSVILERCRCGYIKLVMSSEITSEFEETLRYEKKFRQTEEEILQRVVEILDMSILVYPKEKLCIIQKDLDDNIVLECALAGKSDYIVTGDKHLLELRNYEWTKIVTPREFIDILSDLS